MIELLHLASPQVRNDLGRRVQSLKYGARTTIIERGSPAGDVYFISEGEAEVCLYSADGRQIGIVNLGAGDFFGELSAFDGENRSANVTARSELRLMRMSRADFQLCIESTPAAALWLAHRFSDAMRRLTDRVFELSALNVQTRIQCELLRLARSGRREGDAIRVLPAPTHLEIANRIGTHREAVTREIRALANANILRARRRSLEFIDVRSLERAVQRIVG
ncbi:MAG TPA: Crp/Fnr family transcriptional regulator [Allosphingosinicella sp.]